MEEQAQDVALDLESSWSDEDNSIIFEPRSDHDPDHILYELSSDSDDEVIGVRRVPWGCEGRPSSPADEEEDIALGLETHLNIEPQTSNLETPGTRRYLSQSLSSERGAAELSSMWADAKLSPSRKRAPAQSHVKRQQGFITPVYSCGPSRGQRWRNVKGNNKGRVMASRAAHWPSHDTNPDSKSLHEFSKVQPARMNVSHKGRGQARFSCPREPGDAARYSNIRAQVSVPHLQGTPMTFASRRLASNTGKQSSRELGASSSKKMQNMAWAKGEGRPSRPGAGPVAGSVSRATTSKKETQEKKSQGGGSRVILGRAFPLWGQNVRDAPLEPAAFPQIMGIQILGKSKTFSLLPSGSKQGATGKRSPAKKVREPQPGAGEDKGPNSDSALQTKLSTHKPGPHSLSMHRREFVHVEVDTRAPEAPAASQPLTASQGGLPPRSSTLTGDQEPTVQSPTLERQQPPPGAQGCPRCLVLQKEIDDLKEQLAVLQFLADKFQTL
ncbi:uncharacterized protein CXorf49-like [Octodon degus]|uniref:Uncharacterized protein CXorf49-like n=1 Tax=Octodon degus TaxID=10160 RepID=A0A6P6DT55_OCTDE|nr:uncharacterized protein CXorf49-like [Octodon degus]